MWWSFVANEEEDIFSVSRGDEKEEEEEISDRNSLAVLILLVMKHILYLLGGGCGRERLVGLSLSVHRVLT